MNKIVYRTGNLLDAPEKVIVHGCNAQGVMGSGVAAAIRERYPLAYGEYREVHRVKGLRPGDIIPVQCDPHMVVNAITQEYYGGGQTRYVTYDGLVTAICAIDQLFSGQEVAYPLIGAGLANGKWPIIAAIIESHSVLTKPVVYTLDGVIPAA